MATVKGTIKSKDYCDNVYTELAGMQKKITMMRDELPKAFGSENDVIATFDRHLRELGEQIEWRLQILSHACPFDWKGSDEYEENVVSVGPVEKTTGPDFSGGYLGG